MHSSGSWGWLYPRTQSSSVLSFSLGLSLEVQSPGVRDVEGLGLAAAAWRCIEHVHTLAAGVHHVSHKPGTVATDVLQDTAVGIDVGECLLHAPPLRALQGPG